MPHRTRPTSLTLASIVLAIPVAAGGLAEAAPLRDPGLPAHVRSLSELPPDVLELREALDFCLPLSELGDRDHMISVADDAAFSHLYAIPCAGGGYNLSSVVFLDSAGTVTLGHFETYARADGWTTSPEIFNVEWNDRDRTLSTFLKQRSLGDCGSAGEWRYADGELRLERYFDMPDCEGKPGPEGWPQIAPGETGQ